MLLKTCNKVREGGTEGVGGAYLPPRSVNTISTYFPPRFSILLPFLKINIVMKQKGTSINDVQFWGR